MDENNNLDTTEIIVNGEDNNSNNNYNKKKSKKSGKGIIALALVFAIIGGVIGSAVTYFAFGENKTSGGQNSEVNITTTGSTNVATAVAMKAMPSVVGITTSGQVINPFFGTIETEGTGSGIIIDKSGYILTNAHVVTMNGQIVKKPQVLLNDGNSVEGETIWSDSTIDIAIVKVKTDSAIQPATLGDSDKLQIGEPAIAIGNPIDMTYQRSVTQGIISGLNRYVGQVEGGGYMTGLIQTDASINGGNSGGPLLNQEGEVVGINTVKLSKAEGLGFSIPINSVKQIIKQVIETGDYKVVSIGIQPVDATEIQRYFKQDFGVDSGVFAFKVIEDSPAQAAGIEAGDIITKIDDSEIKTVDSLRAALYNYKVDDTAKVTVIRNGKEKEFNVTFTNYSVADDNNEQKERQMEQQGGNQGIVIPFDGSQGDISDMFTSY